MAFLAAILLGSSAQIRRGMQKLKILEFLTLVVFFHLNYIEFSAIFCAVPSYTNP